MPNRQDGYSVDDVIDLGWDCPPTPEDLAGFRVVWTCYATGSYEGEWSVILWRDGKFYVTEGSHCSCNGLEWTDPVESTERELRAKHLFLASSEDRNAAIDKFLAGLSAGAA